MTARTWLLLNVIAAILPAALLAQVGESGGQWRLTTSAPPGMWSFTGTADGEARRALDAPMPVALTFDGAGGVEGRFGTIPVTGTVNEDGQFVLLSAAAGGDRGTGETRFRIEGRFESGQTALHREHGGAASSIRNLKARPDLAAAPPGRAHEIPATAIRNIRARQAGPSPAGAERYDTVSGTIQNLRTRTSHPFRAIRDP